MNTGDDNESTHTQNNQTTRRDAKITFTCTFESFIAY